MSQKITEYERLKLRRERTFARLQNIADAFKSLTADNYELYQSRFERLEVIENEFNRIQEEIIAFNASVEDEDEVTRLEVVKNQMSFENVLYSALDQYKLIDKKTSSSKPPQPTNLTSNLPKLNLPTFSGNVEHWSEFHSLYKSIVHNNASISDIQKFVHLKSCLSGEALATISNFEFTEENYHLAFEALTKRYQNKRRLAHFYFGKLRNFKAPTHFDNYQSYLAVHLNCVSALKSLPIHDLADYLLTEIGLQNLDTKARIDFEDKISTDSLPTYDQLIAFVQERARKLEITNNSRSKTDHVNRPKALLVNVLDDPNQSSSSNNGCAICHESHTFAYCPQFIQSNVSGRYDLAKRFRRCFNCLGSHPKHQCSSSRACSTCGSKRHHSALHSDQSKAQTEPKAPVSCQLSKGTATEVLLGTVKVLIKDNKGRFQTVRGIVDSGSQVSAISSRLAQMLQLKRSKTDFDVQGVATSSVKTKGCVTTTLRSRYSSTEVTLEAIVLPTVTQQSLHQVVPPQDLRRFHHLQLADTYDSTSSPIHLLLGADMFPSITGSRIIQGSPTAMETIFGYILVGKTSNSTNNISPVSLLIVSPPLDEVLHRFWEVEEVDTPPQAESQENLFCENNFTTTHTRNADGRYVVSLPFRSQQAPQLGNNREMAFRSLMHLETRFNRDKALYEAYSDGFKEYLSLGHMSISQSPCQSSYFMPHHPVIKTSSSSTKVRIVFNASADDGHGSSLNQCLLPGPKLQMDLSQILTRFRFHEIGLSCDIKQMFRQILVHPEHRQYQRVLWRPTVNDEVKEYQMNTVTFGITSSPFLAQRVLLQLAEDYQEEFPTAAQVIRTSCYVDNFVFACPNLQNAQNCQSQLIRLLAKGGFEVRKWSSNYRSLLSDFPPDHLEQPIHFDDPQSAVKVLGLLWSPTQDCFRYQVTTFQGTVSKRSILSFTARVYDPLGWLTPVVIWLKHFLQTLWSNNIDWDDPLPNMLLRKWKGFVKDFDQLASVSIPRPFEEHSRCSLVGFSDASSKAYAAVMYLRLETSKGHVYVHLISAKSKVAPLKTLTIPRLELLGALLLTRLYKSLLNSFSTLQMSPPQFLTDSSTVLQWLSISPHRLKTFVSARVIKILELTNFESWYHISSEHNAADIASRGATPTQFLDCDHWLTGPSFLKQPRCEWPVSRPPLANDELPETKKTVLLLTTEVEPTFSDVLAKYSSLTKLQRVMAYVLRFSDNCKNGERLSGYLSAKELRDSLLKCVSLSQQRFLQADLQSVGSGTVPRHLHSLNPFLDDEGILRVGGRLQESGFPYDYKHPCLISKHSPLAALICDHYHQASLHGGPRLVRSLIASRFWIIGARSLVRARIRSCLTCRKFSSVTHQPLMGNLPAARVTPSPPFHNVAVDFAGPFQAKETRLRKARQIKVYVCVFVCLAVKAIHLELCTELTSQNFLAAFDRFSARRGLPKTIYSDCGRNFVGAARYLCQGFEDSSVDNHLSSLGVSWRFSPAYAPHFNGLAEAGVRSFKSHLYRVVGEQVLTLEEWSTLLARIEGVLNCRPLCPLHLDDQDTSTYLTPGHFLVGRHLRFVSDIEEENCTSLPARRKFLRSMMESFWKVWSRDYLHLLQSRHQWNRHALPQPQVGDIVFLKDLNTKPSQWPMGRISALHPGKDGVARVATVLTATGSYTRAVNKLLFLNM